MNKVENNEYVQSTYQYLHSIPELGFMEEKTSKFIANELRKWGYNVEDCIGTTGIVATLDSGKDGVCFSLRADMDALPFVVDGKEIASHACGHDANSAMVLTVAKEVAERGIKKGKIVFVFQQAEEKVGAIEMINNYDFSFIDEMVGIHLRPIAEAKLGEVIHSLSHSASKFVSMEIKGKASHGARPHLGVNAIDVTTLIIGAINTIHEDPAVPHSIKATQIKSIGNPPNSIPDRVEVVFDVRSQTNTILDNIIKKVETISKSIAESNGATITEFQSKGVLAANYDEDLKADCKNAVINVLGETFGEKFTSGGEDFHYFNTMCGIKTGYIGVGANLTPGVHDINMKFDLQALNIGVSILNELVDIKLNK